SIFRRVGSPALPPQVDLTPLEKREELDLIKQLDRFPEMLRQAAFEFSPHLVADYALTLARAFHAYYDSYRVLGNQESLTTARLALLRGVQIVLHRSLQLLGLSIPEEM
ncbi:arginine--tRNA ligase, partial [Candidatus Bipolaricaulota bacterium]|nr:arginine--tRNA ligase [Candidatus Bipolaricaulota bacterium]